MLSECVYDFNIQTKLISIFFTVHYFFMRTEATSVFALSFSLLSKHKLTNTHFKFTVWLNRSENNQYRSIRKQMFSQKNEVVFQFFHENLQENQHLLLATPLHFFGMSIRILIQIRWIVSFFSITKTFVRLQVKVEVFSILIELNFMRFSSVQI